MSISEEKISAKRKVIIFGALFVILVLLPGISWIYLSGGLNWHKKAIGELQNYGKIRAAYVIYPDGTKEDRLKSKVTVLHIFGEKPDLTDANRSIINTGERLFDQFGTNDNFRMAMISEGGGTAEFLTHVQTKPSADYATWVWTGGLGSWRTILENGYESYCLAEKAKPDPEYFALTDTTGTIRRFYNALDENQVGRMVEHISLLLPKK